MLIAIHTSLRSLANEYVGKAKELGILRDEKGFRKKIGDVRIFVNAYNAGLVPTPYFVEAVHYTEKAALLQAASLQGVKVPKVGDPLMQAIPIYNTVERRYAGFSNVPEQLWYGNFAPKVKANRERGFTNPLLGQVEWKRQANKEGRMQHWLYILLAHRITGSGASFEWDHGFRNNRIIEMSTQGSIERMAKFLADFDGPIFTSIGNQIPPFPKCGGREYLRNIAPEFVMMVYAALITWASQRKDPMPITTAIEMALKFHRALGCKNFKFVITAWVMDIAEYFPKLVDPNSDCYHGKNAVEAIEVCFDRKSSQPKGQAFYDAATRVFATHFRTHPMDVEDAAPGCDFVRWLENYVPKKGFDHVVEQGIFNGSSLVWDKGRQPLPF